jgi:hypothetical protein
MKEYVKISLAKYEQMKRQIELLKEQTKLDPSESGDSIIEWIVNDNGELGVKTQGRCFFLYKGYSLEYKEGTHDDGTEMKYRGVFKREFGECCISPLANNADFEKDNIDEPWKPLPILE